MEHSPIKYPGEEDDVEDGQISDGSDDDGVYIPLARPAELTAEAAAAGSAAAAAAAANGQQKMDADKDDDDDDSDDQASEESTCTDSDSDNALIGEVRHKMRRKLRVKPLRPLNNKPAENNSTGIANGSAAQPSATSSPAAKAAAAAASAASVSTTAAATASGAPAAPAAGAPRRRNNIWATGLQEENLLENLKGCGVDREASSAYDRSVESYDYSLRFRLNGENALKRRKSSNSDSSNDRPPSSKRFYLPATGGGGAGGNPHQHGQGRKHRSVRQRLGQRRSLDQDTNSSNSNDAAATLDGPRIIEDLDAAKVAAASDSSEVIAAELAGKLHEEKDELMLRIVQILGTQLPLAMFAETQRVEADGGMRIMNGKRRRTPGGVFLFLLKNSPDLSAESRRAIFTEESRKQNREQKLAQAQKRDRKVEQLKQTLRIESEAQQQQQQQQQKQHHQQHQSSKPEASGVAAAAAAALAAVSGSRGIRDETLNNLSNPPPSPVTDGNRENSSDDDSHHHINAEQRVEAQLEAATDDAKAMRNASSTAATAATGGYEEDFLDMHCDDMDMF